ncbi:bifunctional nicotinamidase/pyrazinamidase [Sphingobacterium spiritivorum]|uniref:bifunctional nicotinamidase/pyrazinamidase n=1 Tax=Sphingobacterium spiritivorum TaxID=258 RepID=UPI00368BAF5F
MKALIIVDVQNDFLPGGSLAVEHGDEIIPLINRLQSDYGLIVATQDWHPVHHKSFAKEHPGKSVFEVIELNGLEQRLWPTHCVQGSSGAAFHEQLDMDRVEAVFRKGMNPEIDSYSGFFDNGRRKNTGLAGYLRDRNIEEVHVCGLAADYCVYFTAKDALSLGFKTAILTDATKAIDSAQFEKLARSFEEDGGRLI